MARAAGTDRRSAPGQTRSPRPARDPRASTWKPPSRIAPGTPSPQPHGPRQAGPSTLSKRAVSGWPELTTVMAVETIRGVTGTGKVEVEVRYFLTSCDDDPAVLVQAIRRHWSVENALHWVLDVTFREDDSRVRDRTAA